MFIGAVFIEDIDELFCF